MFEYITILAIWAFDTVATMTTFQSKGFGGITTPVQLYISAGLLSSISLTFIFYGVRILYHLSVIERINLAQRSLRTANQTKSARFINDYGEVSDSSDSQMTPVLSMSMKKPSWRIYKVLIFTQSFALATIVGQVRRCNCFCVKEDMLTCFYLKIYTAHSRQTKPWKELRCANGLGCDIQTHVEILHCFQVSAAVAHCCLSCVLTRWIPWCLMNCFVQYACLWIIIWVFHKTAKSDREQLTTIPA